MAKFYGQVGYSEAAEVRPGVWEDVVVERPYYGDILQNSRLLESTEYLNDDIRLSNRISILADPYANRHFFAIEYVEWMGTLWKVTNVTVERPRLILTVGEVYRGKTP